MTYDSAWKAAFAQLSGAGVHVRTYSASAPLYIHAKMILTSSRVFFGSQNFSYTSLERNRELGLITSNPTVRASLRRTFDSDYAGARPYTASSRSSGGRRRAAARPARVPPARGAARARLTQAATPTTTYTCTQTSPGRPSRSRTPRTLCQLSHRLKRLRRRLLPRSGQRGRRDGHGTRRARHLPRQAEPLMRAIPRGEPRRT